MGDKRMTFLKAGESSGGTIYATCINTSTGSSTHDYRPDERGDVKILPAANNISSR